MKILKSLLTINDTDIYDVYRAFLAEDKPGGHENYNALLQVPAVKPYTTVAFREQNGEALPESLPHPHYEARDVTLQFGILADSPAEWYEKYIAFIDFLKNGWLVFALPELGTHYRMYFKSSASHEMYSPLTAGGKVYGKMKLKFCEPNPYQAIDL